jgi:hypothetical protein
VRVLLRAIADGKPDAPDQILARWTWRLARATRKVQDRRASAEYPEAKRLLGALANSRGHRHEENARKLVETARELPIAVAAALLASAEGYTPRANQLIDAAREQLGTIHEVAFALSENLPAPKQTSSRSRRRRRRKKKAGAEAPTPETQTAEQEANGEPAAETDEAAPAKPKRRRRRRKSTGTPGANTNGASAHSDDDTGAEPEPIPESAA